MGAENKHICDKWERLTALEVHQEWIMKELQEIKTTLHDFIKAADKKYSAKWVERTMLFTFWVVWSTMIGSIMLLVLK